MVNTFRILVANQPKLTRELLVEMLAEESWIEIVGEVAEEAGIRESVAKDCARPSGGHGPIASLLPLIPAAKRESFEPPVDTSRTECV